MSVSEYCSLKVWLLTLRLWKYEGYINSFTSSIMNECIETARELLKKILYWKKKREALG